MTALAEEALKIADGYVGQAEVPLGSNWGPFVKDCLASVGINFPAYWCMAFAYRCFNEAATELEIKNPLFKTGGVINQWNMSKASRVLVPEPGDLFILKLGPGAGHTGIVETVSPKGVLGTIEGNSNNNGSHNGVAVVRHTRHIGDPKIIGYLRF